MDQINILGIDLGTTKSVIAVWDLEACRAKVLRNREGDRLTPSVVTFDSETKQPIVGKAAIARMLTAPHHVLYSVKRFIGRTFRDKWVAYDQAHVTYHIEEAQQRKVIVRVGEQFLTPPQISAEVLRKLKEDAEAVLGAKISQAVVTVPAYFDESQRQATKEAADLAGLRVPWIINEPTASALAFGLGSEPQTVAIYDLGGGTFDISILRIEHGLFRVKATGGDTHLGGSDFDLAIVAWMKKVFEQQHGVDLPVEQDDYLRARLRQEAERAKIALSTKDEYFINLLDLFTVDGQSLDLAATLSRSEFENMIQPDIKRSLDICDLVLEKARLGADKIDQVLLVGGQTRTPAIKAAIRDYYGWKLNDSINPDEVVAQGAAVLGARLCGYLKDQVTLWDVIPLSLGIELPSGEMFTIIEANEQIPTKRCTGEEFLERGTGKKRYLPHFTTHRDGQERILFCIYQGERPFATDNTPIGKVELSLATSRPAGEPRIKCIFKVDHDGILHVQAEDVDTEGEPVEKTFDRVYQMTQEEVEKTYQEMETHKDEDAITRRIFRLQEDLAQLRKVVGDRLPGDLLVEYLNDLEAAINARDVSHAEKLLIKIKEMR